MKFLLDTDTCYALKQDERVLSHLLAARRVDVGVSVITEAELRTGAAKSSFPTKALRLLENFLRPISVAEFTSNDALAYARSAQSWRSRAHRSARWIRSSLPKQFSESWFS